MHHHGENDKANLGFTKKNAHPKTHKSVTTPAVIPHSLKFAQKTRFPVPPKKFHGNPSLRFGWFLHSREKVYKSKTNGHIKILTIFLDRASVESKLRQGKNRTASRVHCINMDRNK
jgi:hypothetical protein